ncbi:AAA family ATPase [Thalassolituus pacificus]|uniref:AAA family ATPase n=1 Tax=Thalassolituus pacificus TaxID=2975440 RepID=A0A9X3ARC5_9GAMM|nr:AAA family ATPase [Thalassolituus pacificus]MCT7358624.1 AAA family ATPase [Thalassolituus pacificus]
MKNNIIASLPDRKKKIAKLIGEMNRGLLERTEQVKLILLAALAGEHVLLLGPPGTAKSELAKRLKSVFVEANYFERLLTRFSVPEEVFGPLSIQALEQDQYKRLTSGYLPEASVAFIDEIFKANSAILNSLLTLLNERQFDNGNRRYPVPLISVVAASNELPEGEELDALYDRFMLRSFVHPVSDSSFTGLLTLGNETCDPDLSTRLKIEDLAQVQQLAEKVELTPDVIELCNEFRRYLQQESIYVSDRRWRKLVKLMKVSAFTSGFNQVSNYDAWILPHCLWQQPKQLEGLQQVYEKAIAVSGDFSVDRVKKLMVAWESKLKEDSNARRQKMNADGKLLYKTPNGKQTTNSTGRYQKTNSDGEKLYLNENHSETTDEKRWSYDQKNKPVMIDRPNDPIMEPIQYSASHIQERVYGAASIKKEIENHIERLSGKLEMVDQVFAEHLWINPALMPVITANISKAKDHTETLLQSAEALINGFENLPVEDSVLEALAAEDDDAAEDDVMEGELCD